MKIKSILLSAYLLLCSMLLCGCSFYKEYEGEYSDLYTEACCSLVFSNGFLRSESVHQSAIDLIEEDDYGRKLFSYYEKQLYHFEGQKYILSLLVCQKSDYEYVYYYPDYNFYSIDTQKKVDIYDSHKPTSVPDPLSEFTEDEINALKEKNDWNKELQIDKCVKQKIFVEKEKCEIDKSVLNGICNDIVDMDEYSLYKHSFLCSDEYGRKIYCLEFSNRELNRYYIILLNPDLTYDKQTFSREIFGPFNCQNEIYELKQNNNWNMPILIS